MGIYIIVIHSPLQFQPILFKREIRLSLGTKEVSTGRLYVAKLDIEIDTLIHSIHLKLKQAKSPANLTKLLNVKSYLDADWDMVADITLRFYRER